MLDTREMCLTLGAPTLGSVPKVSGAPTQVDNKQLFFGMW